LFVLVSTPGELQFGEVVTVHAPQVILTEEDETGGGGILLELLMSMDDDETGGGGTYRDELELLLTTDEDESTEEDDFDLPTKELELTLEELTLEDDISSSPPPPPPDEQEKVNAKANPMAATFANFVILLFIGFLPNYRFILKEFALS